MMVGTARRELGLHMTPACCPWQDWVTRQLVGRYFVARLVPLINEQRNGRPADACRLAAQLLATAQQGGYGKEAAGQARSGRRASSGAGPLPAFLDSCVAVTATPSNPRLPRYNVLHPARAAGAGCGRAGEFGAGAVDVALHEAVRHRERLRCCSSGRCVLVCLLLISPL